MSELEDLKAKYDALKKANLEKDIAMEQAKLDEAEKIEDEEKNKTLRDEIKAEVIKEMEVDSVVDVETTPNIMLDDFDKYVTEPFYKRFHVERTEGDTADERYINRLTNARNRTPRNRGAF